MPARDEETIYIPDTMAAWPWPRALNAHYESVSAASLAWLWSFGIVSPKAQLAFAKCDYGLLAGMAYPSHSKEAYRLSCDVMNYFFVIDDATDDASPEVAAGRIALTIDAMRRPDVPRPADEWRGGEVGRAFWARARQMMRPSSLARLTDVFEAYLVGVGTEAVDRAAEATATAHATPVYTFARYVALRRDTAGTRPCFALIELGLADLDEAAVTEAVTSPLIQQLSQVASDMIMAANDMFSYNRERTTGAFHNLITVVYKNPPPRSEWPAAEDMGMPATLETLQDAIDWVAAYHRRLARDFLDLYAQCTAPGFLRGATAALAARRYASGLGCWMRANDQWSFEGHRYFGSKGSEVQVTRTVQLLPLGG